jgi:diaminopimelate decarboxylase
MTLLDYLPSLHKAADAPDRPGDLAVDATVDDLGRLCVGDVPLTDIADEFRTPTYVLDETDFRHRLQRYRAALPEVEIVYAAKALLTTDVARWVPRRAPASTSAPRRAGDALAGGAIRRESSCTATRKPVDELPTPRPSASGASSSTRRWRSPTCAARPAGRNAC